LCRSLQQTLSQKGDGAVDDDSDTDGQSLYDELKTLANILPQNTVSPLEVLRYVVSNGLQELLPNLAVALCILPTVPVTVASGERSFFSAEAHKNCPQIDDVSRPACRTSNTVHKE